jgi:hypothetical protein
MQGERSEEGRTKEMKLLDSIRAYSAIVLIGMILLVIMGSSVIPSAYNLVESSGTPITRASTLNFTGSGVSVAGTATVTTVTISGGGGGGSANYSQSFTSQTSVALAHGLGTTAVLTDCYDTSVPPVQIFPNTVTVTNTNTVTVTFSVAQSGYCVVNGSGGGGGSSVNAIPTVVIAAPSMSSFTWVNQSSSTAGNVTVGGVAAGIQMNTVTGPGGSGISASLLVKNRAFAAPYTLEVGMFSNFLQAAFLSAGAAAYNSTSTNFLGMRAQTSGAYDFTSVTQFYNSPTSEGSATGIFRLIPPQAPLFFRIVDDGSGTVFTYTSADWGRHYYPASSTTMTFDQVGIYVESAFTTSASQATFFHFAELNTSVVP